MILENYMLTVGEKKYYIIITRWQHVLGLFAEGFEMHDSTTLVTSSTCWRCGAPHKAPPLPAYLDSLEISQQCCRLGLYVLCSHLFLCLCELFCVCQGSGNDRSLSWLLPI